MDNFQQSSAAGMFDLQSSAMTGNLSIDCLTLVERYEKRYWRPPFQRAPLSWPEKQRRAFIERLRIGPEPIGTIVIYVSEDDPHRQVYILDGVQRIASMREFYLAPEKYKLTEEDAKSILHNVEFPLQRRTYANVWDAYADFLRLQSSLALTEYETNLGQRALLPQWAWFSGFEQELHGFMENVISGYGVQPKEKRESKHRDWRHNLGLFLRFVTGNKTLEPWQVTGKVKDVETKLREELEKGSQGQLTMAHTEQAFSKFKSRMNADFATIEDAWSQAKQQLELPNTRKMQITVIRFLHECSIYAELNGVSRFRFHKFAAELLVAGEGVGQIPHRNDANRVTLGLGKLGRLAEIARHTTVTEDIRNPDDQTDKSNGSYPVGRGQDRGHLRPRSLFGNGPTAPEPSSLNRAKGNRTEDSP